MQRTWGGLFKNWWGGGSFNQCMGKYGGRDSLEKGKYLANSYTAARVNVYYKLSSFFQMLFQNWSRDINGSLQLLHYFPGIIS